MTATKPRPAVKSASKPVITPAVKPAVKPASKAGSSPSAASGQPAAPDASALLKADHQAVSALFTDFFPEVRAARRDEELGPEAIVEHASLKGLLAGLEGQAGLLGQAA